MSEDNVKNDEVDEDMEERSSKNIVPSRKRRRLDEEPEEQARVDVLPAKGQERPLEVDKTVKNPRVELRFTLIMEYELDMSEQKPPPRQTDFNRIGDDMLEEARRVRRCWHWVLVSGRASAYCMSVYNRVVLMIRCLELKKAKEAQARLDDLDRLTVKLSTFEEREEWLKVYVNDMEAIKRSATAFPTEDERKHGRIAEEFLNF